MTLETEPTTCVSEAMDLRKESPTTILLASIIPSYIWDLLLILADECNSYPFILAFTANRDHYRKPQLDTAEINEACGAQPQKIHLQHNSCT